MDASTSHLRETHTDGVRQVLALVEARAPRDCSALGGLQAQRLRLAAQALEAREAGNVALASEVAARIAATDVEIGLALGVLAARNREIARLCAAVA